MTGWLLAVLIAAGPASVEGARAMTLEECVRMALERNADIAGANAEVDASRAARASIAGNFGPRVQVEGNILRWEDAYEIPLAPPPAPPMTVRDELTSSLTVRVVQPITALAAIYEGFRVRDLGVDVARVRRDVVRRDTVFAATEAYFRLLQAQKLAEVSRTSVEQVQAQLDRAKRFETQGVLARNDVLRAEIALAAVKQRQISAEGQVSLASSRLAMAVGLPASTRIAPSGAPEKPAAAPAVTADEAVTRASAARSELAELDARIRQARSGRNAAWTQLAPNLSAIASYQTQDGFSTFQEKESRFAGLLLTWNVWDWGSSANAARESAARVRQAEAARAKVADGIAIDARAAWIGATTAQESLRVAEAAVAQAEENYRIESRRYEQNASTTFDVLDAEALLTQARVQYLSALYESHVSAANLTRAMGDLPGATITP